jgi:phosphate uptake regulator
VTFVFRSIIGFWKGREFVDQVLEDFSRMLIDSEEIYLMAVDALRSGGHLGTLGDRIYEIDKQINHRQRKIRRGIVAHMTVQPKVDLRFPLVLMSVVKDAERLGDYVKNLFEVFETHDGAIDSELLNKYYGDLPDKIGQLFKHTHVAFVNSNEDVARQVIDEHGGMMQRCNEILAHVSHDNSLSVNDAVSLALYARFLKRIAAHLGNIATSVVVSVDRLDYFDEDRERDS